MRKAPVDLEIDRGFFFVSAAQKLGRNFKTLCIFAFDIKRVFRLGKSNYPKQFGGGKRRQGEYFFVKLTPRPATLVKEARVARCLLSRVDTGIRVELAVL